MKVAPEFEACFDACNKCLTECQECVRAIADVPNMQACLDACYECIEECRACIEAMGAGTTEHCLSCAAACDRCAAECEPHIDNPDCQEALAACRQCAEVCRETAGVAIAGISPGP